MEPGGTQIVEPCDLCGAVGYPEAIATCIQCKVNCAHVYCMKVFLKIVPDDWICEICDPGKDTTSLKYVEDNNFSRDPGFDSSDITGHENTHSTSPSKMHNSGSQTCSRSQKVGGTGKVKFISEEEAIRLCGGKVSSKSFPTNSSMQKMYSQSKKGSAKVSFMNVKPNSSPSRMGHGKLLRHSGVQKTTLTNQQSPQSLAKDRSRECDWRDHSSSFIRPVNKEEISRANALKGDDKALYSTQANSLPINTEGVSCANDECSRSNVDERDLPNTQNFQLYLCCIPSSYATWKGGFKFQSAALCDLYDGLEALPSCTVHRKAYYYSCKLPAVLEVEPLPISSVLIDLFQNDCPGLQEVALYFFPSDNCERSRQNLNLIFGFLDTKNAMLKSVIDDGVELLVFTSKQLNEDSQGIIEKLEVNNFLWGVFRPKEDGRAIEELNDTEAADMDVDMVGGQDVSGRIDSVQNRIDKHINFSINSGEGLMLKAASEKAKDNKIMIASGDLNLNVRDKISLPTNLEKNIKTEVADMDIDMVGGQDVLGRIDSVLNRKDEAGNLSLNYGGGTQFPFDIFPLKSVQDYYKIMDTKIAPPGFERVHELKDSQPLSLKSKRTNSVENREDRPGNLAINSGEGAILENTSEKAEDKKALTTTNYKPSLISDLRKNVKTVFPFDEFPLKSVQDYHKIMDTKDAPPGFEGVQEEQNLENLKFKRVHDLY
ncbi:hypothetical protein QN277_014504 [Acacia crassicarpa]|uniref:AIPP2-like SPOC-like domain-containing protein n=1 Tax=Acacia crassicarpa TaxID=499986 RepID=A0AAE1IMJ1_9FABA|nr:hypothetical protein QN277_014504 [Acacia crassicarpa]